MFGGQGTAARPTNQRGVLQTAAHLSPTLKWDSRLCHIFLLIIVPSTNFPFVFLMHGVLVSDLTALTLFGQCRSESSKFIHNIQGCPSS